MPSRDSGNFSLLHSQRHVPKNHHVVMKASLMKHPLAPSYQRDHGSRDDAALETRITACTATPPAALRHTVLTAVREVLHGTAAIEPLPTHPAPESVWGVLAGVSAVALALLVAPLLATPVVRRQPLVSPAAAAPGAEDRRVHDIVTERDRLLTAMAYAERPQRTASARSLRLPTDAPIGHAVLRPGDLRTVLEEQL